ncbi:unnamed protein product [Enterobius vermicularis]|uniref:30S ribosomal protein S21 n=1 Tax=Enterobius vermicularis TaxID=51028 RepID=A0A0N4VQX1_ENTVE|nr:unnamed protein product [Enterobius vermicularis]
MAQFSEIFGTGIPVTEVNDQIRGWLSLKFSPISAAFCGESRSEMVRTKQTARKTLPQSHGKLKKLFAKRQLRSSGKVKKEEVSKIKHRRYKIGKEYKD